MKAQLSNSLKNDYAVIIFYFALTILVHGIVLFNDGVPWDDTYLFGYYQENNIAQLRLCYFSLGLPLFYYIHRMLWFFNYGIVCTVVSLISIVIAAFFSYKTAKLFRSVNNSSALLIGLFFILYPGSYLTFYRSICAYYIMYAFFFIAFYLGLKAKKIAQENKNSYLYHILSLILFFISFSLQSLLVYYALYIVCLYIIDSNENYQFLYNRKTMVSFLKSRWDCLLLPISFFLLTEIIFKTDMTYNNFKAFYSSLFFILIPLSIFNCVIRFIWLPSLFFLITSYFLNTELKINIQTLKTRQKKYLIIFLLGIFALLLGIFPYVIVGKAPWHWGLGPELSRNALLVTPSMALILTGFIGMMFREINDQLNKLGKIFICIFSVYFCLFWINCYLTLQTETAFRKSFVVNLESNLHLKNYSFYWMKIDPRFHNIWPASTLHYEFAPSYEWTWLLNEAYSGHSRYGQSGLPSSRYDGQKIMTEIAKNPLIYKLENIKNGSQIILNIRPGHLGTSSIIGLRYLYYIFFRKSKLNPFLLGLLNIYPINFT